VYEDAVITVGATTVLTRAASAPVNYRKNEKIQVHTAAGAAGVFYVKSVTSTTAVVLGTYDQGSLDILDDYADPLTGVYTYALEMEAKKGSVGTDYSGGVKQPYRILSVKPQIHREVYDEFGSVVPQIQWVKLPTGETKWFLKEIDNTRKRFFRGDEIKLMEGKSPAVGSDAADEAGFSGTTGAFEQIRDRGATWTDLITTKDDLEALIKHYNKVNGAGQVMFLCGQDQEFAFDDLGKTFNANYGSATIPYIGEYMNSEKRKVLDLNYYGFHYGGYTFFKQGWKYLKDNTFRGNDAIADANKINFLAVPIGMTPVSEGDQSLAFNPTKTMNYMSKLYVEGRDYMTSMKGGFGIMGATGTNDDRFEMAILGESCLALFNAEKFLLGEGVSGS
jgi:hypothetical protein